MANRIGLWLVSASYFAAWIVWIITLRWLRR
jgi:hypothetical protein